MNSEKNVRPAYFTVHILYEHLLYILLLKYSWLKGLKALSPLYVLYELNKYKDKKKCQQVYIWVCIVNIVFIVSFLSSIYWILFNVLRARILMVYFIKPNTLYPWNTLVKLTLSTWWRLGRVLSASTWTSVRWSYHI